MKYLTRNELQTLARMCERELYTAKLVTKDEQASKAERAFADFTACYMEHLMTKLDQINDGKTRRIEITI